MQVCSIEALLCAPSIEAPSQWVALMITCVVALEVWLPW